MSLGTKKITIYSSPQSSPHQNPFKLDINQNASSQFASNFASPTSQRSTFRMRISNPRDLELLQLAASRGNATFVGKKIRIVSVHPSATPSQSIGCIASQGLVSDSAQNANNNTAAAEELSRPMVQPTVPEETKVLLSAGNRFPTLEAQNPPSGPTDSFEYNSPVTEMGNASQVTAPSSTAFALSCINPLDMKFTASAGKLPTYCTNSLYYVNNMAALGNLHVPNNQTDKRLVVSHAGTCHSATNSIRTVSSFTATSVNSPAPLHPLPSVSHTAVRCTTSYNSGPRMSNSHTVISRPAPHVNVSSATRVVSSLCHVTEPAFVNSLPLASQTGSGQTSNALSASPVTSFTPFFPLVSTSDAVPSPNTATSTYPAPLKSSNSQTAISKLPSAVSAAGVVPLSSCSAELAFINSVSGATTHSGSSRMPAADTPPVGLSQNISTSSQMAVSQRAKYIGTFSVNVGDASISRTDGASLSEMKSRRVVLRISAKNNTIDVNSLTSASQWPVLVKAVEKMLAENGTKSIVKMPPCDREVLPAERTFVNRGTGDGESSKASYRRAGDRTVYGTAKRTADDNGSTIRQSFSDRGPSSRKYKKLSGDLSVPSHLTLKKPVKTLCKGAKKSLPKGHVFYYDGCQIVHVKDRPAHDGRCARTRPFATRKKRTVFSFLSSRYRRRPTHSNSLSKNAIYNPAVNSDLPMAMRFRDLHKFVHSTVGVYRSEIHGLGLFARRRIVEGEMVVEYAGEVIRAAVADVRERQYESRGIGCYMFRHGDDDVVDATRCGNVARFINHSCEPNCYSREVVIDGRRHILIFSLRTIRCGEELTYDYKFPIEDVKMPCLCNVRRCRKYLN